jgi:hypothetical protein
MYPYKYKAIVELPAAALVDAQQRRRLAQLVAALYGLRVCFPLGRADLGGARLEAERAQLAELGRTAAVLGALVRAQLVPVRHDFEDADPLLALRRVALVRALLAPEPGTPVLFEPRLAADESPEVAASGAVRLELDVLGTHPPVIATGDSPGRD